MEENRRIPIKNAPFAVLHLWSQIQEAEQFEFDFLGFSVGQIPVNTRKNVDKQDLIDVNGKTYQLGKVLRRFILFF